MISNDLICGWIFEIYTLFVQRLRGVWRFAALDRLRDKFRANADAGGRIAFLHSVSLPFTIVLFPNISNNPMREIKATEVTTAASNRSMQVKPALLWFFQIQASWF